METKRAATNPLDWLLRKLRDWRLERELRAAGVPLPEDFAAIQHGNR